MPVPRWTRSPRDALFGETTIEEVHVYESRLGGEGLDVRFAVSGPRLTSN